MDFILIRENIKENKQFTEHPDCQDSVYKSVELYKKIGYNPPWICYYAQMEDQLVGVAAFKGKPVNGKVEIAYGVFPDYWNKGIGTLIAKGLVELALYVDPSLVITARTLPQENYSTKILQRNNFGLLGPVIDEEGRVIWEWQYLGL